MGTTATLKHARPSIEKWRPAIDCIRAVLRAQGGRACLDAAASLDRLGGASRRTAARKLPVVAYINTALSLTHGSISALAGAVETMSPALDWRQPYPRMLTGAQFQRNYGETEIAGGIGPLVLGDAALGLFLLGPGTYFPSHTREHRQIIMVLGGTGDFQRGHGAWIPKPPASFVVQKPLTPQAFRTGGEPLLGLYLRLGPHADRPASLKAAVPR